MIVIGSAYLQARPTHAGWYGKPSQLDFDLPATAGGEESSCY